MIDFKTYLDNVINDPTMNPGEVKPSFILEFQERCYIITCEKLKKDLSSFGIEDGNFITVITEETRNIPSFLDKKKTFLFHERKPRKNSAAGKTIEKIVKQIFPGEEFGLPTRRGLTSLIRPPDLTSTLVDNYDDILKISENVDNTSKEFYAKLLAVLKNGRNSILAKYISPGFKMYNELVVPSTRDIVVSGGLYNSVEVGRIINQIGPEGKLIGFEPNKQRYLEIKKSNYKNFTLSQKALGSEVKSFTLFSTNGIDSRISDRGDTEVSVTTIDNELHSGKCDLIKLNINGYELEALKGAKSIITKYKPKIQTLLTLENIVELPKFLLKYNPDYTFYFGYYDRCNNLNDIILYAI